MVAAVAAGSFWALDRLLKPKRHQENQQPHAADQQAEIQATGLRRVSIYHKAGGLQRKEARGH